MKDKTIIEPRNPKGMRDFLPAEKKSRDVILQKMRSSFESYGFEPIETPAVEMYEILSGNMGSEEKLIYRFKDNKGRELALRYDQTVPLARLIAQYPNIQKPFKRYQIQNAYRAENTQQGRFREFLQVDIDNVGSKSSLADAEIIACALKTYQKIGLGEAQMLINSRPLLFSLLNKAGVENEQLPLVTGALDKLSKVGKAGVTSELSKIGLSLTTIDQIFETLDNAKPNQNLREILDLLSIWGFSGNLIKFSPYLARGLNYYTDVIFEASFAGYDAGSLGGGGRFDNLIGSFIKESVPAVGFSFGFDRILEALMQRGTATVTPVTSNILVTVFDPDLTTDSVKVAEKLREYLNVELYTGSEDLNKQLKYADNKKIPYVVIVGPREVAKNMITIKNMTTQEQNTLIIEEAAELVINSR